MLRWFEIASGTCVNGNLQFPIHLFEVQPPFNRSDLLKTLSINKDSPVKQFFEVGFKIDLFSVKIA
jgi:hypothetical protein